MKIVLAGASGFIGRPLITRFLCAGHALVILSRQDARTERGGRILWVKWDARSAGEWTRYLEDAEAVINLAGEPLTVWPWTLKQKQRLLESRVAATRALVNAMGSLPKRPRVFVNASAIGYYGSGGETVLDENSLAGKPYLATLCQAWEASASAARSLHIRVVCARLGLVLGGGGGVLQRLVPIFRYYLGGPLGSGKQWLSWIQLADAVAALEWLLTQEQIDGPVNLTSPEPVRMQEFCRALGNLLHRPSWLRVPGWLLRLVLGDMAQLFEGGQRVNPVVLHKHGFSFAFPTLSAALSVSIKNLEGNASQSSGMKRER